MAQNKRTIIKEAIESGEYTKEQLMEKADVNAAGFASQLSYLRMGGIFPVADSETGIFKIVTEAEWNELQANRKSGKPKEELTPATMRAKLEGKAKRAASAQTNAAKKAENSPDDKVLGLKAQKAALELEICEIELGQHQSEYPDLEDEIDESVEEVDTEDEDEDGDDEDLM